ncbi:hypothetical protein TWF281_003742 [Arthrobotrys megalospora]
MAQLYSEVVEPAGDANGPPGKYAEWISSSISTRKAKLDRLLQDKSFRDLIVVAGKPDAAQSFMLHKLVVNQYSQAFENFCRPGGGFPGDKEGIVYLQDIQPQTFQIVQDWMYQRVSLFDKPSLEVGFDVLLAANMLVMPELKTEAISVILLVIMSEEKPDKLFKNTAMNVIDRAHGMPWDVSGKGALEMCLCQLIERCSIEELFMFWGAREAMGEKMKEAFQKILRGGRLFTRKPPGILGRLVPHPG